MIAIIWGARRICGVEIANAARSSLMSGEWQLAMNSSCRNPLEHMDVLEDGIRQLRA
jgi:hypothetical protein